MTSSTSIVRGTNDKPAASLRLIQAFDELPDLGGQLFIGYPVIGSIDGRLAIDALYVSPTKGVVVLDLVEGSDPTGFEDRQDLAATRIQQRLLGYKDLVRRRQLLVSIHTLTFAPNLPDREVLLDDGEYLLVNAGSLGTALENLSWQGTSSELYTRTLSAIQNVATIRRTRTARSIKKEDSRGAKLQRLEDSIATLDNRQGEAVIETVDGVQRIRGLAGSGKTIILALKAAYLHAQHPEWRIAVTFNTRSLKGQFRHFITTFMLDSTSEEPDWTKVHVVNSWGAPGGGDRDGMFYEFCVANGATYRDFREASSEYGREEAFDGACTAALEEVTVPRQLYDVILVDEAQDLPPTFLRMCYFMLDDRRRLVYAYDELQNLSGEGLPSATEIFGTDLSGRPRVTFDELAQDHGVHRDIVLEKCYRNSRPVLVSAHGLGFGIYRRPSRTGAIGLVQMFDQPSLWRDIGYCVKGGDLSPGSSVTLARSSDTSPLFLEEHSPIDDLVQFMTFKTQEEQNAWVAAEIKRNLEQDELRHNDIVVINTDPLRTRRNLGPIRKLLLEQGISSHLAGVDTGADVFFQPDRDSITFSGVYRAKGNEAGMVYIVNADECESSFGNLARVRNRLFTAITRSKAWVRVLGVGPRMQELVQEFNSVRAADFELIFRYPSADERDTIQIIHRDMTQSEQAEVNRHRTSATSLLEDLESGKLYREDLDPELRERLAQLLKGEDEQ